MAGEQVLGGGGRTRAWRRMTRAGVSVPQDIACRSIDLHNPGSRAAHTCSDVTMPALEIEMLCCSMA